MQYFTSFMREPSPVSAPLASSWKLPVSSFSSPLFIITRSHSRITISGAPFTSRR